MTLRLDDYFCWYNGTKTRMETAVSFASSEFNHARLSVADRVLRDLESSILSGRLERGSRLPPEKELASHYGVSVPTIREAVRALSAMRLIEVRHGSGTTVTADSSTLMASAMRSIVELEGIDLESILKLSEALNLQAIDRALAVADDVEIARVREIAESFVDTMSSEDFTTTLHEYLYGLIALSHDRLLEVVASYVIDTHLELARHSRNAPAEHWPRDVAALRDTRIAIIDGLAQRDRQAAFSAVRKLTTQTLKIAGNAPH